MNKHYTISVGDDELYHSKGPWKNHKYLQKIGNKYIYGKSTRSDGPSGNGGTDYYQQAKNYYNRARRTVNSYGKAAKNYIDSTGRRITNSNAYKSARKTLRSASRDASRYASKTGKKILDNSLIYNTVQKKKAQARQKAAEQKLRDAKNASYKKDYARREKVKALKQQARYYRSEAERNKPSNMIKRDFKRAMNTLFPDPAKYDQQKRSKGTNHYAQVVTKKSSRKKIKKKK